MSIHLLALLKKQLQNRTTRGKTDETKRTKSKEECNDFKNAVKGCCIILIRLTFPLPLTLTLAMHTKSHFQGATNMSRVEPLIRTFYLSKINYHDVDHLRSE